MNDAAQEISIDKSTSFNCEHIWDYWIQRHGRRSKIGALFLICLFICCGNSKMALSNTFVLASLALASLVVKTCVQGIKSFILCLF